MGGMDYKGHPTYGGGLTQWGVNYKFWSYVNGTWVVAPASLTLGPSTYVLQWNGYSYAFNSDIVGDGRIFSAGGLNNKVKEFYGPTI